jgi:hypothetical protein
MPSMSYCMFENTSIELSQCVDAMENANDIEDLDLSSYEQDAFREMYALCKAYINEFDRIEEESMEGSV